MRSRPQVALLCVADAVSGPIERARLQGLLLSRVQIAEDVHAAQILTEQNLFLDDEIQ